MKHSFSERLRQALNLLFDGSPQSADLHLATLPPAMLVSLEATAQDLEVTPAEATYTCLVDGMRLQAARRMLRQAHKEVQLGLASPSYYVQMARFVAAKLLFDEV